VGPQARTETAKFKIKASKTKISGPKNFRRLWRASFYQKSGAVCPWAHKLEQKRLESKHVKQKISGPKKKSVPAASFFIPKILYRLFPPST